MAFDYDMLIVGGGINGTAIARDAAGRGLKVLLCERDDLASHTSSSSTKLIHGGLRYLEYYEFKLVREALIEREVLLGSAPHIIWPMRFVLPYDEGLRPAWMLRLGLFLYDSLGGRKKLPGTRTLDLRKPPHSGVLEGRLTKGFEYSDCWVEDARLVVLNAIDARALTADIRTRTEVVSLSSIEGGYEAEIRCGRKLERVTARCVVNSAGPWVDQVLGKIKRDTNEQSLRLVKGSHIVLPKLYEGDHAYIFQNKDNRIIFAIPYERNKTLIGTTDVPYSHTEGPVKISPEEIEYLCSAANEYFEHDISPSDVAWTYSGVRPLYDDRSENASAVTRDYVLDIEELSDGAPLLSIYGGKITTSRKLAEHAMEKLEPFFDDLGKRWTESNPLPGGDMKDRDYDRFRDGCLQKWPHLPASLVRRLCRAYGTRIELVLEGCETLEDMGENFGQDLTEAEIKYLQLHEWVTTADDVLWRRTKLGVHMSEPEIKRLNTWFETHA